MWLFGGTRNVIGTARIVPFCGQSCDETREPLLSSITLSFIRKVVQFSMKDICREDGYPCSSQFDQKGNALFDEICLSPALIALVASGIFGSDFASAVAEFTAQTAKPKQADFSNSGFENIVAQFRVPTARAEAWRFLELRI
jgi:hypothetical protein